MGKLFEVIKSGLATSVQDLGRTGFQQYGVVVSGAMDSFALQVANLLVGNLRDEAGLEVVIMGPELFVLEDTVLAICGADLSPKLDGKPVAGWKSFIAKKGQRLSFGQPQNGSYAYIAAAGGINTPPVMGSRSTYTKAGIGGFEGRHLQKGDRLEAGEVKFPLKHLSGRGLFEPAVPNYARQRKIRVVLGPDQHSFKDDVLKKFCTSTFKMTSQSDRMGYRLEGPELSHVNGADIISDAILPGAIQVPASGQPIILLADRQTTGGYARIATVVSSDLPYVVQKLSGSELEFQAVSVEKAQRLYVSRELLLRKLSLRAGNML
ncbi:biotin-dependent carboxyltransferase family protein [Oceanobacillus saliphilus]|uniref:5-oxoprolinase subunit C family protein n=1 Tax=Oceanobacillus saliphilus TaxID=2925834 RepID=UPI00201D4C91|nr:biotin-dependent carboxyltransferase family protein [Oceanobacillus saliphilus]